jgi:hypothetical protein
VGIPPPGSGQVFSRDCKEAKTRRDVEVRPGSLFPISLYPAQSHTLAVEQLFAFKIKEKEILN